MRATMWAGTAMRLTLVSVRESDSMHAKRVMDQVSTSQRLAAAYEG